MATKTDIELKIVDSVDTSHTEAEVLADSASNPDAFYVGRGYLAHNGEKVIEGIDTDGTYPNVTVGNATKATTADTANRANTAATAATAVNVSEAPVLSATEDEQITVKVGNKTSNALTVPYAQRADFATDLSGRVEATPEVFTYRPSAGDKSIKDDNAFIRRVKGNSVVWNQLVKNGDFASTGNWVSNDNASTTLTIEGGKAVVTSKYAGTGLDAVAIRQTLPTSVANHKYFVSLDFRTNNTALKAHFEYYRAFSGYASSMFRDGDTYSSIFTAKESGATNFLLKPQGTKAVGDVWEWDNVMVIDLTAMFDAGNEPATVEEFRELYPNSYYPYNAGELRNLNCYGIKTVGFNEFNGVYAKVLRGETYYLGGEYTSIGFTAELGGITETITIPSNRLYTPTETGYIYATGTDICINLSHTGYRDGEYAPYKEVTHALPLSQITNGQPLRKAGSVYDEINETEYIKRVGVRSYTEGDKDDAALLTDGTYTNYPLAEPIVTPITTPIDFNYYVEDFGTEEALLTEDSAPFSADIVYQFNATDNIRQNRISIQKLNNIFSGSGGEYVRADGSWGYIADLKGNFFAKPTLKRIRTGISELSDTIQIIHPYLTEHAGDAEIVLMAVKRRGGTYYNKNTNAKGRRKKRKAWGELHYAAMPEAEINHNTIVMPNGASFEAWQSVILTACGRIPEGLENAREPYNVNVASEDLAEFFAANGAIFVGKTPAIRLGIALRIPNPNFIDYGNGKKMWDYNDVTGKWEYKYLYSDVAEVVVKSQMLRTGGYVLGLELV